MFGNTATLKTGEMKLSSALEMRQGLRKLRQVRHGRRLRDAVVAMAGAQVREAAHPVAKALGARSAELEPKPEPRAAWDLKTVPGYGLEGRVQTDDVDIFFFVHRKFGLCGMGAGSQWDLREAAERDGQ